MDTLPTQGHEKTQLMLKAWPRQGQDRRIAAAQRRGAPGYFHVKRQARGRVFGSVLVRAAVRNNTFCCNS